MSTRWELTRRLRRHGNRTWPRQNKEIMPNTKVGGKDNAVLY